MRIKAGGRRFLMCLTVFLLFFIGCAGLFYAPLAHTLPVNAPFPAEEARAGAGYMAADAGGEVLFFQAGPVRSPGFSARFFLEAPPAAACAACFVFCWNFGAQGYAWLGPDKIITVLHKKDGMK